MINFLRISGFIFLICIGLSAYTLLMKTVLAAECTAGFCPLADVSGSKLAELYSDSSGDLGKFINSLFTFALSIGAILAVLRIAWGGYLYMVTDMWSTKDHAKEILSETILGLFLLIAVYLILHQINPNILKLDILKTLRENRVPQQQAVQSTQTVQSAKGDRAVTRTGIAVLSRPERRSQPQVNMVCGSDAAYGAAGSGLDDWICGYESIGACTAAGLNECQQN